MEERIFMALSRTEFKEDLQSIITEVLEEILSKKEVVSPNEIMTREETMLFLGCSSPTLIKYQKEGLPHYSIGRKILFKKNEILEFARVEIKY